MLSAFRRYASSWPVKILFGVLVLSFVIWGVADVFRPGMGADWVAKVGSQPISAEVFSQRYREARERLSQMAGTPIDAERARALGLQASVLRQLVQNQLLRQEADALGLTASDDQLRRSIENEPAFRNSLGMFDRQAYDAALRRAGWTRPQFEAMQRDDLRLRQLTGSVTQGLVVAPPIAELLNAYETERRALGVVELRFADQTPPKAPSRADLEALYKEQIDFFRAPEQRSISLVLIDASRYAEGITVTEDDARDYYQRNLSSFGEPEKRTFKQRLTSSEAEASALKSLVERAAAGDREARGALERAAKAETIGPAAREQLPAALRAPVFDAAKGETVVASSPLGWHVVTIDAITPGSLVPFEKARADAEAGVKRERALDLAVDAANKLDDGLGRGLALEEAAAGAAVEVERIASIDDKGRVDGKPLEQLPLAAVEAAFATEPGQTSALLEVTPSQFALVRVDAVAPATPRPFEAVASEVEAKWIDNARRDAATARADAILSEAGSTIAQLEAAARRAGATFRRFPDVGRQDARGDVSPEAQAAAFEAPAGAPRKTLDADAVIVVQSERIPGGGAPSAASQSPSASPEALRQDAIAQFLGALEQSRPVKINHERLAQLN